MNDLESIIKPHKLNHGRHDTLIRSVESETSISPNVITIAMNAYYKLRNKQFKGGYCESDIDLIQMLYDNRAFPEIFEWQEVPFNDGTLLVYEMKSTDSHRNRNKAMKQLDRTKNMILRRTHYETINCFYCFNVNTGYMIEYQDNI